jgi:hypothetical protein
MARAFWLVLSNLAALLRQQLFVYRPRWRWLDPAFEPPLPLSRLRSILAGLRSSEIDSRIRFPNLVFSSCILGLIDQRLLSKYHPTANLDSIGPIRATMICLPQ